MVDPYTLPGRAPGYHDGVVGVLPGSVDRLGLCLALPGMAVVVAGFLEGLVAGGVRHGAGDHARRAGHKPAGWL